MSHTLQKKEPGFGWMLLCSTAIHLVCYFLLVEFQFSPRPFKEGPIYYVDVVNLPVANPRAGTPSSPGRAPSRPVQQEMALPAKSSLKASAKPKPLTQKPAASGETARQFEERMAKIERDVDAKHHSAALDALQKKVATAGNGGQTGMPGAKGTEAGSDYAAYIRSRLMDAFRTTIVRQTKNPEVMVRLTIDRNGKVIGSHFEKSSKDRIFEDSVRRTILKAEQTFPPPPGGVKFEYVYRFAPEEANKK
jgi:colicin import membrane protein